MNPILRRTFAVASIVGIALAIAGCASVGRKIDQDAVSKIQKGVSTKADVRGLIGAPDHLTRDGDGNETWTYTYARAVVKGESFIPIYGSFGGGTRTQTHKRSPRQSHSVRKAS